MQAPTTISVVLFTLATSQAQAQNVAPFKAATLLLDNTERMVKTADLDGDGWSDAIGWWQITDTGTNPSVHRLKGYMNDHSGKVAPAWSVDFTAPLNHWAATFDPHDSCAVADLDHDGDDDFVISTGSRIDVWLSNGASLPTRAIAYPSPAGRFYGFALADFDLDGDLDIGVNRELTLEIYDLDLVGSTMTWRSAAAGGWNLGRLLAVEATGDAYPDLVVDGRRIFPVVGSTIGSPTEYAFPWSVDSAYELRHDAGDIDGDGDVDIVTFRKHVTQPLMSYRVLRRTGPATFVSQGPSSGGPARRLFDVDGDGDLDGVCCGGGGGGPYVPFNNSLSTFRISLNDGTGTFAPAIDVLGMGSTAIAGVEDMNHDGSLDLVAGRCILFQHAPITAPPMPIIGTHHQNERTLQDIDGDGDVDVEPLPWSVRRNRGDGEVAVSGLSMPPAPAGHERTGQGHYGDWDGDGDVDLLWQVLSGGAIQGLQLLRNVGCGSFTDGGIVAGPEGVNIYPLYAEDGLAGDVDGDGDLDLVLRSWTSQVLGDPESRWLRNDGAAGFVAQQTFDSLVVLDVTELNGDGVPDLVAAGNLASSAHPRAAHVAFGLGGGAFAPWQPLGAHNVAQNYNAIDVADLDGDGDRDVALVDFVGVITPAAYARVLWNNGTGSFSVETLPVDVAQSGVQSSARALDVDDDRLLDLVFAPSAKTVYAAETILRRADNSGWGEPVTQLMLHPSASSTNPPNPRLTAIDLDGDGDTDLVTDRMIPNARYDGPDRGVHVQSGSGLAGEGGITPLIGAIGPFRVGLPVRITVRGLKPGASGVLVGAWSELPPATGMTGGLLPATHMRIVTQVPFVASGASGDESGSGSWDFDYTVPTYAPGRTKCYVAYCDDPSAPGGTSRSNRVYVSYGP